LKFGHESLHLDNAFYRLRPKLSASQARFSKDNFSSEAGTEMGKKEYKYEPGVCDRMVIPAFDLDFLTALKLLVKLLYCYKVLAVKAWP
jgi:hypothetical protein